MTARELECEDCPVPVPLIIAGWVLVTPTTRPQALGDSLPSTIVTISDCIQEDLPQPFGCDWFLDVAEADLARRDNAAHAIVVSVSMRPRDAAEIISQIADEEQHAMALLRRQLPLDAASAVLGFEVVGAESPLDFHSWHCHGYADEVEAELGIRTNSDGLIATVEEAAAVRDWMLSRPPEQAPAPVPWCVVALARA